MNIPLDKQAHFFSGAALALALGYVIPAWAAFVIVLCAGAAKEVYDHYHQLTHTADWYDLLATSSGGLVGSVIVFFS